MFGVDGYSYLEGAELRVRRAQAHLQALAKEIAAFEAREMDRASLKLKPGSFWFARPESPIPKEFSVAVGEIVYNLRAALDYLVFDLSRFDSGGVEQSQTQFPIEDHRKTFWKRRRPVYLKGLSDVHAAAIERLQPYEGCDWTRRLRDLSNPDKHRRLTTTDHNTGIEYSIEPTGAGGVNVNFKLSIFVAFKGGASVVKTLRELVAETGKAVVQFKPEFE